MAAILQRDGELLLVRAPGEGEWRLPGGALPDGNDDIDAEMAGILADMGIVTAAVGDDFYATHYFPAPGGQTVYNLFAVSQWFGEPDLPPGHDALWTAPAGLRSLPMHDGVREVLLEAFGLRGPADTDAEILGALAEAAGLVAAVPAPAPGDARIGPPPLSPFERAADKLWPGGGLDPRTRSLEAVALLAALGHAGPSLEDEIKRALHEGASPGQLVATLQTVAVFAGFPAALAAWPTLARSLREAGVSAPELLV